MTTRLWGVLYGGQTHLMLQLWPRHCRAHLMLLLLNRTRAGLGRSEPGKHTHALTHAALCELRPSRCLRCGCKRTDGQLRVSPIRTVCVDVCQLPSMCLSVRRRRLRSDKGTAKAIRARVTPYDLMLTRHHHPSAALALESLEDAYDLARAGVVTNKRFR
jgi:hypothetical protein